MRKAPTLRTVKQLFANSGGVCAYPGCITRLIDPDTGAMLGEMCHIKAASPNGPRHDGSQSDEQRNSADNLILLCPTHHSLIDQAPNKYPASVLQEIKETHEAKVSAIIEGRSEIGAKLATNFARQVDEVSVDFAIITALPKELKALLHYFPELKKDDPEKSSIRSYYRGTIATKRGGSYRIVVSLLNSMGNLEAAHATSDLINKWNPRFILVCGIAGGLNSSKQEFGDIVVSDSILYYEFAKLKNTGLEPRFRTFNSDRTLIGGVQRLLSTELSFELPERPDQKSDTNPLVHVGVLASGEKVITSSTEVEKMRKMHNKLIAVEMESAGVASASFSAIKQVGFLTIRSICDFADDKKADNWQEYAAHAAAAFVRMFIESQPVSRSEGEWPSPQFPPTTAKTTSSSVENRKLLFSKLKEAFDMEEFANFCFLLGVDIDEIPGNRKSSRIRELILLFERRNEIELLESAIEHYNH